MSLNSVKQSSNNSEKPSVTTHSVSKKEDRFKKATMTAMCIFGGSLLVLAASAALLFPLGVTGAIVGGVLTGVVSTGLIISSVLHCCAHKLFKKKPFKDKLTPASGSSLTAKEKIKSFEEAKKIEENTALLTQTINEKGPLIYQKKGKVKANLGCLETASKNLSAKLEEHEEELQALEKNIEEKSRLKEELTEELASHKEKKNKLQNEVNQLKGVMQDIATEVYVSKKKKPKPKIVKSLKTTFHIGKDKAKLFEENKQVRLNEHRPQLQQLEENLRKLKQKETEQQEALEQLNQNCASLLEDQKKMVNLVQEEKDLLKTVGKALEKETETLDLLEKDLQTIEKAKEMLQQLEASHDQDITSLPAFLEETVTSVDHSQLLKHPLLASVDFSAQGVEEENFTAITRTQKGVKKAVQKSAVHFNYQLWSTEVSNTSFITNSPEERVLSQKLATLFDRQGRDFSKKAMKVWNNPILEIGKDLIAYNSPLMKSDFFGFLTDLHKILATEHPLKVLHALLTDKELQQAMQPAVGSIEDELHKSSKQKKNETEEQQQEKLWIINAANMILNVMVSGIFVNPNFSQQEITEFCSSVNLSQEALKSHVEEGTLMTEILRRILEGTNTPVPGLNKIKYLSGTFPQLCAHIKKENKTKSISEFIPDKLVEESSLSTCENIEELITKAPHLLNLIMAYIRVKQLPKGSQPIMNSLVKFPMIKCLGAPLLKNVFAQKLFSKSDLTVFAQFLGWNFDDLVNSIENESFLPRMIYCIFRKNNK